MNGRGSTLDKRTSDRFNTIVPKLLRWYGSNKRNFVWRRLRTSPYRILVSEFMLQQTQAGTIDRALPRFLKQFPTAKTLAEATTGQVIRAWQGLGYNRRALNLQRSARMIAERGRMGFPRSFDELVALPGVGPYTASAILAFSFNEDVPVIDVNVERVLSRLWKRIADHAATLPKSQLHQLDARILPKGNSAEWHQALMDLGATICTKRAPKCSRCPVSSECRSANALGLNAPKRSRAAFASEQPREAIYFGKPKRIWRGRILKCVAEHRSIATIAVVRELSRSYSIPISERAGFSKFARNILVTLDEEGFLSCDTRRNCSLAK